MNEVAPNILDNAPDAGSVTACPAVADNTPKSPLFPRMSRQLREWLRVLHHDPTAEERVAAERRARLLDELNHAVADAPDDMPLRDVIARINNTYSD